ncbi:MAG: metallophosphoesterase [Chthoniobacterales bacterium]
MPNPAAGRVAITPQVLLDGRLALFHTAERWLAVADLHFGYELSQRAAGRLMPLWGMTSVEDRLMELLLEYQPRQLLIVGDLVHDKASTAAAQGLLSRLREHCEVIALAGNHDRHVGRAIEFAGRWETPDFVFQHGHCEPEETDRICIIGHHHPAASITDGAGLRLKFPAFIQQETASLRRWILPAFSPWAGGVSWPDDGESRIWLCSPGRVLRIDANHAAA